jgi:diacylglycerol kinase (ATP)
LKTLIKKLWLSTGYSLQGLARAIEHEFAFRLEIFIGAIAFPIALYFGSGGVEKALLVSSLLLVYITELANSAIEAVVDRISLKNHELSGRAKDLGSATVLVACLNVIAVWSCVFYYHL